MVRDLMKLCFLMEKRYAPYSKWFGTAFAKLECSPEIGPVFEQVLSANSWREREEHLSRAYGAVARMHNALGVTPPLGTKVSPFHTRPYLVLSVIWLRPPPEDPRIAGFATKDALAGRISK